MSRQDPTIDPSKQKLIDSLQKRIKLLKDQITGIERTICVIQNGQSPIQPNDIIEWESGKYLRRGLVISVNYVWQSEFEYRCHLLRKDGRVIGYAKVGSDRCPTIVKHGRRKKK
jgi:hypothetical protein